MNGRSKTSPMRLRRRDLHSGAPDWTSALTMEELLSTLQQGAFGSLTIMIRPQTACQGILGRSAGRRAHLRAMGISSIIRGPQERIDSIGRVVGERDGIHRAGRRKGCHSCLLV